MQSGDSVKCLDEASYPSFWGVFYMQERFYCRSDAYLKLFTRFKEGHVESQTEGNHQEKWQNDHLQKGVENVYKHHDEDAGQGELAEENDEVNPAQKDGSSTNLPLPFKGTEAICVKDPSKDDGTGKEGALDPVDPVEKVA